MTPSQHFAATRPSTSGGLADTTTSTARARRFANPDEADRQAARRRYHFPHAEMTRHPHGTDRARGFAVELHPGRWLAD